MIPTADNRLHGRFALVTGAATGIGRAVAEHFAAAGATVALNHLPGDVNASAALAAVAARSVAAGHGVRRHRLAPADLTEVSTVATLVSDCVAAWGRLDSVVNNAGIQSGPVASGTFDAATFAHVMAVNITAAAQISAAAIAHFLTRPGGGTIINTTSVHEIIPKPGFASYAVSKGALSALTRTLALEYADRGIRVNAVGPGAIKTPMNDGWRHDAKKSADIERHIPMGFAATPDDIAGVYSFLASDDARYITGQTIFACGGLTLFGDFKQNWAS
jgi:glucose 1-dehydrogenase